MAGRNSVNEIIKSKLYQRGQILSWQRDVKLQFLQEHKINIVANFWPKVDCDLNELPVKAYFHMPCIKSEMILDPLLLSTARFIGKQLQKNNRALVLCEAGVTRSVFFCILITAAYEDIGLQDAYELVEAKLSRVSLKPFMLKYIASN